MSKYTRKISGGLRAKRPKLPYQTRLRGSRLARMTSRLTAQRPKGGRGVNYSRVKNSAIVKPQFVLSTGDLSRSMFKLSRPPSKQVKAIERIGAPIIFIDQVPDTVTAPHGFQQPHSLSLFNKDDLLQMADTAADRIGITRQSINYVSPSRFVCESAEGEFTFTNMTLGGVDLEIYDVVLKRDIPSTNQITISSTTFTMGPSPDLYWNEGAKATNNPRPFAAPNEVLGSSPFDSPFFKDYFKVMKRTIVQLKQGSAHRHNVWLKPNALIDDTVYSNENTYGTRGLTTYVMYNVRGLPMSDTTGHLTTTGQCQVNCVLVKRYKFTCVVNNLYSSYYRDSLTSPATGSIVNIGSGTIGPDTAVGV